ncbi:MAG: alginate export family protein [Gammaproteobacteria bacterium]|nr:alginate export family protein [Gammaproteobacteria bacterium]
MRERRAAAPARTGRRLASLCACLLLSQPSHAEWRHELGAGLEGYAGLEAGFAAITMINANLGLGRVNALTGVRSGDPTWTEVFIEPRVGLVSDTGLYGQVSIVGATTFFDGDAAGFTGGGDGSFDWETAFVGWRSGLPDDDQARPVIDVSIGRQMFDVGDGFLIDDGNLDAFDDGGAWLVPRQAFRRTAIARVDFRAWHGDAFYLQSDPHNEEPALIGGNLEYRQASGGHVGVLYFHILDADRPRLFLARDGMEVLSVRVNDLRLPILPQVGWWAEATRQFGTGRELRFDASAFYLEGIYHFAGLPWRPRLSYRYAYFSGDEHLHDATRRDFDPLFYGFDKRVWGTWFQGELTGGWLLFNNNQRNHLLHLLANPTDRVTVGAIGGRFELVKANYRGVPVTDKHFSDELNLYVDWLMTDQVALSAAWGVMFPGDGAAQGVGDDEAFQIFEMGLNFNF